MNITKNNLEDIGFKYNVVNGDNFFVYDFRDLYNMTTLRMYEHDIETGEIYLYEYSGFIQIPKAFKYISEIQKLIESIE